MLEEMPEWAYDKKIYDKATRAVARILDSLQQSTFCHHYGIHVVAGLAEYRLDMVKDIYDVFTGNHPIPKG